MTPRLAAVPPLYEMFQPTEVIDDFLTEHNERNYYSRREVVDILLDVRFAITEGGEHGQSIPEGHSSDDRADNDARELALSSSEQ